MTVAKDVRQKEIIMGKLQHGSDLLEEFTQLAEDKNIRLGRIEAIGAVQKACIGYYHQDRHEYRFIELNQPLEIVSLTGNISIKEGKPIVHSHIALADNSGALHGGHLAPGTTVFACEYIIEIYDGPTFERSFDPETELPLWNIT